MKNKIATIFIILFSGLCGMGVMAQQPQDSLSAFYTPYRLAMQLLYQSQPALPQDSAAFAGEWQRLYTNLKRVSDSIAVGNTTTAPIYFELQRLIDKVTLNTDKDSLQPRLTSLYQYISRHQYAIVENSTQFTKVAQCLMGIRNDSLTSQLEIARFSTRFVRQLYMQLDTRNWDATQNRAFVNYFAAQYANMGNIGMAEKIYRLLNDLWVTEQPSPFLRYFSLPEEVKLRSATMGYTNSTWKQLPKGKLVLFAQEEDLSELVYLITTLRAFDERYRDEYDAVIVCNRNNINSAYLKVIKQNLAFENYYIALMDAGWMQKQSPLPAALLIDAQDSVVYQAQHISRLFEKLNSPIEAAYLQSEEVRLADLAARKEQLKQKAAQMADSVQYRVTHQKITFILKGLWEEGLVTRLTPVRYSQTDTLPDTTLPYLAQLEVQHPQYIDYQLLVMVNGKKQEITITSGDNYRKTVRYATPSQSQAHEAIQNIDKNLGLSDQYGNLLKTYPFQQSAFIKYIIMQAENAEKEVQQAIHSVKKGKKVLQRYAEVKKKQRR
jgi:hypothetical protein